MAKRGFEPVRMAGLCVQPHQQQMALFAERVEREQA